MAPPCGKRVSLTERLGTCEPDGRGTAGTYAVGGAKVARLEDGHVILAVVLEGVDAEPQSLAALVANGIAAPLVNLGFSASDMCSGLD